MKKKKSKVLANTHLDQIQKLEEQVKKLRSEFRGDASVRIDAVPKIIRQAREDAGLTQDDVAKASGLTRPQITNIEAGRSRVTLHRLILICLCIGVTPDMVLGFQDVK